MIVVRSNERKRVDETLSPGHQRVAEVRKPRSQTGDATAFKGDIVGDDCSLIADAVDQSLCAGAARIIAREIEEAGMRERAVRLFNVTRELERDGLVRPCACPRRDHMGDRLEIEVVPRE